MGGDRVATYTEEVQNVLTTLERIEGELDSLAEDTRDLLDTDLREEDVVNLLWARQHDRTKSGTREALDALQSIGEKETAEIMVRLTAAYGNMSMAEAEEFVDDLYDLRDRYGSRGGT